MKINLILLAINLSSVFAEASLPTSCLSCAYSGYTWDPTQKLCGTNYTITLPFDCTEQNQYPKKKDIFTIDKLDQIVPYLEKQINMSSADITREYAGFIDSHINKELQVQLLCQPGSKIKVQGFSTIEPAGKVMYSQEPMSCENPLWQQPKWFGGFTLVILESEESVTFRISEAPPKKDYTALIIGLSVGGGVLLLAAIGVGIYCFRQKKRQDLKYGLGTDSLALIQGK
ncbi:hypothetical protein FGO68_gene6734 [Halteria grandinella]|uniref:Uncharacterized protein n=1 Tax=Halteria grandinella TaxID=5974 RepID=A0A8J8NJ79_HALGN|nr:hypothetical protein FGO68_gene6734 [Halteria grandinella]